MHKVPFSSEILHPFHSLSMFQYQLQKTLFLHHFHFKAAILTREPVVLMWDFCVDWLCTSSLMPRDQPWAPLCRLNVGSQPNWMPIELERKPDLPPLFVLPPALPRIPKWVLCNDNSTTAEFYKHYKRSHKALTKLLFISIFYMLWICTSFN